MIPHQTFTVTSEHIRLYLLGFLFSTFQLSVPRGADSCRLSSSGVTMGWLLRPVTGGPTGGRGPPTVLEFLVIDFSVYLVLLSNCYTIIYCIVWFQVQPLMVVFQ